MRVLGLHVKGGVLNYGLLDGMNGDHDSLAPVAGAPGRLQVDCSLAGARQLTDLAGRFGQDLSSMAVERVALLSTRRYAQWKYADAWDRISRITVVMLVCDRSAVSFEEVKTEVAGKALETPAADIASVALSRVGLTEPPKYWTTGRAEAFCAAATVLA